VQNIAGLPDFSWYNIPKREKIIPNNQKISQMATKYPKLQQNRPDWQKTYQHLPLQDPPKFAQIAKFWLENVPSGNP
jgi:hypothetical protein